jgi:hypothetical protein
MRRLVFAAALLTVATIGFHAFISASLAAAHEAKTLTFSERFASALELTKER